MLKYKGIADDELHVLKGSKISKALKTISGIVSMSLIAIADRDYEAPNYVMGFSENLRVIEVERQKTPLIAKNYGIIREEREFRSNDLYTSYQIVIESPSQSIRGMIYGVKALAPWAAVDRPYRGK
jgi:hypothetical protein